MFILSSRGRKPFAQHRRLSLRDFETKYRRQVQLDRDWRAPGQQQDRCGATSAYKKSNRVAVNWE